MRGRPPDRSQGRGHLYTGVPQRISTFVPRAAVTLSDRTVWARTSDGDLWLAAALPGRGLSWGYGGSGPHALAALLNRLLDTNGRPADLGDNPPEGLLDLIAERPQDGTTTYAGQAAIGAPIRLIAGSSSPAADCRRRVSWRAS
jgi:hypothetical protein